MQVTNIRHVEIKKYLVSTKKLSTDYRFGCHCTKGILIRNVKLGDKL